MAQLAVLCREGLAPIYAECRGNASLECFLDLDIKLIIKIDHNLHLTLRASPSNSALSRERGMPFAAENRKLSHVQRKKSNLTQLHRNFKTAEPIYVCRTISQENKGKCKSSSKIYIQRKSNCKSWSIFNCKSWSILIIYDYDAKLPSYMVLYSINY